MPAVIRGAPKGGGGKRARKPQPAAYAPTKLRSAAVAGVDPRAAVWMAAGVAAGGVVLALAVGGAGALAHQAASATADLSRAAGFRLQTLTIRGGTALSTPAIARAVALNPGDPILAVNLDKVRENVEGVGWVKTAAVRRLLPDTIVVTVKPRVLLAVWQHDQIASVVDADGVVIPEADARGFTDLPLIVGEGANETAGAILPLLQARPRLMSRIDALQRLDGRRWRLSLKGGGIIELPAQGEDQALIRFDQLDTQLHWLDRGFDRVDLRDPLATPMRPKGAPAEPEAVVAGTTE